MMGSMFRACAAAIWASVTIPLALVGVVRKISTLLHTGACVRNNILILLLIVVMGL
jgi:hypothetical protein